MYAFVRGRLVHLPSCSELCAEPYHLYPGEQRIEESYRRAAVLLLREGWPVSTDYLHLQGDQQHLGEQEGQSEEQF